MTVRVDTQAAQERAETVLAYVEEGSNMARLARDVLALAARLEAAETENEKLLRQRDEARRDEALARAQLAYWRKGYEDAVAAGRGEHG